MNPYAPAFPLHLVRDALTYATLITFLDHAATESVT